MDKFEERLYALFHRSLNWRWQSIEISLHHHRRGDQTKGPYRPFHDCKDVSRKFIEVFIHLPKNYMREEKCWQENASPLGLACTHTLYSTGLAVVTTDAFIDPMSKCYRCWVEMNQRTLDLLPPLLEPLKQREYYNM